MSAATHSENLWWVWALVATAVVVMVNVQGAQASSRLNVILGGIEVGIFAVLSVWLIIKAGNHNTLQVLGTTFATVPAKQESPASLPRQTPPPDAPPLPAQAVSPTAAMPTTATARARRTGETMNPDLIDTPKYYVRSDRTAVGLTEQSFASLQPSCQPFSTGKLTAPKDW